MTRSLFASRRTPCSTRSRPPAFIPVKVRGRKDGWSHEVQCAFLAQLYATGSVAAAAKAVGRSRASAYKLRARRGGESFAASWDKVFEGPCNARRGPLRKRRVPDWRKLTHEELFWRVEQGFLRPVIYRGKMRGIARKPDNSGLLRLLSRLDRGSTKGTSQPVSTMPSEILSPALQCLKRKGEHHNPVSLKPLSLKPLSPSHPQSRQ